MGAEKGDLIADDRLGSSEEELQELFEDIEERGITKENLHAPRFEGFWEGCQTYLEYSPSQRSRDR